MRPTLADPEEQLREDRMLRNAARRLLRNNVANLRGGMAQRGFASRALGRARDGSAQLAENAIDLAHRHRMGLGTGLLVGAAAVAGWLFRDRLADAIYDLVARLLDETDEVDDDSEEPSPVVDDSVID